MKLSSNILPRLLLAGVLIASFVLRWALAFQGGQFFNPDEYRYLYSREIAHEIQKGNLNEAMIGLTREPLHQGFIFLGVIPAMVERARESENPVIPALFFGLFSWMNIGIVWLLARRLGADETEALWAVFLAAASSALFYYSSHLFPYDVAMTFALLALYVGLRRESGLWASILTGVLGFISFFIYNGYWPLVGFAFMVHVLLSIKPLTRMLLKSFFTAFGFIAPLLLMAWVNSLFGNDLLNGYRELSNEITNGDFSEGAILPFTYLWAAERSVLIVWLALIIYAIFTLKENQPPRAVIWLGGALLVYLSFAIPSVILHKFVVYGRLVRQLVPFLALAGAYGLRMVQGNPRWGRVAVPAILLIVIVQAGVNFRDAFQIIYPADFIKQVRQDYPDFKPPKNITYFYTPNVIEVGPYKAYYIKYISTYQLGIEPVQGEILMSAEHPLSSFAPFRYEEGFTAEEKLSLPPVFSTMMLVRKNP